MHRWIFLRYARVPIFICDYIHLVVISSMEYSFYYLILYCLNILILCGILILLTKIKMGWHLLFMIYRINIIAKVFIRRWSGGGQIAGRGGELGEHKHFGFDNHVVFGSSLQSVFVCLQSAWERVFDILCFCWGKWTGIFVGGFALISLEPVNFEKRIGIRVVVLRWSKGRRWFVAP